jgi:hypothetical protein
VAATYVSTGASITPGAGLYAETAGQLVRQLNRVILDAVARRYDYVLLPAIDLSWTVDRSAKKHLRSLVRALLFLVRAIRARPFGRGTVIAVMDRYDAPPSRKWLPLWAGRPGLDGAWSREDGAKSISGGRFSERETDPGSGSK